MLPAPHRSSHRTQQSPSRHWYKACCRKRRRFSRARHPRRPRQNHPPRHPGERWNERHATSDNETEFSTLGWESGRSNDRSATQYFKHIKPKGSSRVNSIRLDLLLWMALTVSRAAVGQCRRFGLSSFPVPERGDARVGTPPVLPEDRAFLSKRWQFPF